MEDEEEQIYWNKSPSLGYIFEETIKEIRRKAWQRIKFNDLLDHPQFLSKLLPTFLLINPPIAISMTYSLQSKNIRTKWKTVEQISPNFKFRWKKTVDIFGLKRKRLIVKETSVQLIYNPFFLNSYCHKFNGSKTNLKGIHVLICNLYITKSQNFLKKNIFKKRT
jgi:hypothetical protein